MASYARLSFTSYSFYFFFLRNIRMAYSLINKIIFKMGKRRIVVSVEEKEYNFVAEDELDDSDVEWIDDETIYNEVIYDKKYNFVEKDELDDSDAEGIDNMISDTQRRVTSKRLENKFQADLIKDLKHKFPNAVILKTDPKYKQGIPDLLILNHKRWAALECKKSSNAKHQPNQDYYVKKMDAMSYSAFVYPENKEDVIDELIHHFR